MSKYLSLSSFTSALFCIFSNISGALAYEFFYKSATCNQSWWLSLNHRKVFCWRIFVEHSDVGDKNILITNRETESFSTISSLSPIFFIIIIVTNNYLVLFLTHFTILITAFVKSFRRDFYPSRWPDCMKGRKTLPADSSSRLIIDPKKLKSLSFSLARIAQDKKLKTTIWRENDRSIILYRRQSNYTGMVFKHKLLVTIYDSLWRIL